ncbi:MAG: ABC transporter permease [Bryobacteraceae bacterium]
MGNLLQDARYALRTLFRARTFALVSIATLALGIGANSAIFSLVYAVLLKPLPYREPARLLVAWDTYLPKDKSLPMFPKLGASPPELDLWRAQTDIFEAAAWYRYVPYDLTLTAPGAEAISAQAGFLSTNFLPVMGVAPLYGRGFGDDEPVDSVLLSHHLWQTHFAGDPAALGRTIRMNDQVFHIVGIMPAAFKFPDWADLWLPPGPLNGDELTNPVRHAAGFIGRLKNGVTSRAAAARLEALSTRLALEHPSTSTGWGIRVSSLQDDVTANIRPALLLLWGAVALVLLIACGNVANLLLARASGRVKEIAVRSALGAGGWRIARQLLTESVILAAIGGVLGVGAGEVGLKFLSPVDVPLDSSALLILFATTIVTGIAFGLAPALQALRVDPNTMIKAGSVTGGGSSPMRAALVVVEIALALVLVTGAGILVKSFMRLMQVDPGFESRGLITMRIAYPPSRDPGALFHRLEESVKELPGVDLFASTSALPLTANHGNAGRFNVPGSPLINPEALPAAQLRFVSPGYFETMRIPIVAGRAFTAHDVDRPVVVINQTMARRFWPGRDPVGAKFISGPWGPHPTWATIIGISGDVKQFGLDSAPSFDLYSVGFVPLSLIVHVAGDPRSMTPAVRQAIQKADPDLAVSEVRTMDQVLAESAISRRWTVVLLAAFAALALILALVGVYGVMTWSVAQRTREIGIRVALGAGSGEVLAMIIGYGLKLCVLGLALGMAGAFALRRLLTNLVFDVSPADPLIYAGVAALMFLVALLACYIPARRASRVDPLVALRCLY